MLEEELDDEDDFLPVPFFSAALVVAPFFAVELLLADVDVEVRVIDSSLVQETKNAAVVRSAIEGRISFFMGEVFKVNEQRL